MRKISLLALSTIGWFALNLSYADDSILPKGLPDDLKFSGYFDASYNYLFRSNHFTSSVNDRLYDINPNGFTVQQAAVTLAYQPKEGFGALINPIVGKDPTVFAPYGIDPSVFGSQWWGLDTPQEFIQYAHGPFTLMGGRFFTIAGVEVVDPTQDTNFSRSILFGYAEPTSTIGLRGTYVVNDKLTLIAGIDDGWDNIRDWGRGKTIELGLSSTINSMFSFSVQGYAGDERATHFTSTGPIGRRNLIDVIGTYNATDKLTFIGSYDYAWQTVATLPDDTVGEATWSGFAGYANYKFNDQWRTSLRGEIFDDNDGYRTGVAQVWKEITLTIGFVPIKNSEIRVETRRDFSNVDSFVDKNESGISNNQQSFAVEGYYKF